MLEVSVTRHPKGRSVIPDSPEAVIAWIAGKPEGWRGTMILQDFKKPRSVQQNKTVRGFWIPFILPELGYRPHDAQYVYDKIKMAIGWTDKVTNKKTGEVEELPRPTADLDTAGYAHFMEIFRAYVEDQDTGFGIRLPDPDPTMARI